MTDFLEILKYILPSIIVLITAYLILDKFMQSAEKERKKDLQITALNIINPIRLQAYERITLFLERIGPEALIMRVQKPGMTVKDLQRVLLQTIRDEFEHNIAQQIYISQQAWTVTVNAKESIVQLINATASEISPDLESFQLAKKILEKTMEVERMPNIVAIDFLKKEIHQWFGN